MSKSCHQPSEFRVVSRKRVAAAIAEFSASGTPFPGASADAQLRPRDELRGAKAGTRSDSLRHGCVLSSSSGCEGALCAGNS
jgi:hypothetical protein